MATDAREQDSGSLSESLAYCCVEQAALEALPVPIVVHDLERVLLANAAARAVAPLLRAGTPFSALVPPENTDASGPGEAAQANGSDALDIAMHVRSLDGREHSLTTRGATFRYGEGTSVFVQVVQAVDDRVVAPYVPESRAGGATDCASDACLHEAAYEALPIPSTVIDKERIVRANGEFRRMLNVNEPLRGASIDDILHPDFAPAGAQRRHLVVDLGAPVVAGSVKFRTPGAEDVYSVIDARRIEYENVPYMTTAIQHATRV